VDRGRVVGILAVIFPPADRAKLHGIWYRKRARTTAGTAKSGISHPGTRRRTDRARLQPRLPRSHPSRDTGG
jgi:hypothetical protein